MERSPARQQGRRERARSATSGPANPIISCRRAALAQRPGAPRMRTELVCHRDDRHAHVDLVQVAHWPWPPPPRRGSACRNIDTSRRARQLQSYSACQRGTWAARLSCSLQGVGVGGGKALQVSPCVHMNAADMERTTSQRPGRAAAAREAPASAVASAASAVASAPSEADGSSGVMEELVWSR